MQSESAPFLGGTLYATPASLLVVLGTDASVEIRGSATFSGAASGLELRLQVAVRDASLAA